MENERQCESIGNMLGYYEYMCWYTHDQAHELDPISKEHAYWYNQFRGYWSQKVVLLHNMSLVQATKAVDHLIIAVQHHDFIELQGVEGNFANWLPAIWELNQYFSLILPDEIAKQAAEIELQRWYAHRQKRFDDFAELTNQLYLLEFGQQLPEQLGMLFAQAAKYHDIAEKEDGIEYWELTRKTLQKHFKLLMEFRT